MGRKNLTFNKEKLNFLIKLFFCFIFALILAWFMSNKSLAATGKLYLSDIDNDIEKTKMASGHILKKDGNDSDKIITLKISENKTKSFVKGITAWATSEVVYDLKDYSGYDYFTATIGVDVSEQSNYYNTGARFEVYTSNNGQDWVNKDITKTVFYGWSVAEEIKVPLEGARFLKLVTNSNSNSWWAEWYDETVFADAKLLKNDYVEEEAKPVDFIKPVQQYDEELKNMVANNQTDQDIYELTLLQREFVNNFGYDVLVDFVNCDENYKDTVSWLMTNLTNMKLYVYGGEPDGNYIASMKALNSVYQAHKADLENHDLTRTKKITYGELYRKMMITVSLTHSAQVSLWMQTDTPENQSTALTRYEIFKDLHKNDDFVALRNSETNEIEVDYTPLFESLEVEEMRFVLNNIIDDESIYWLNDYVHNRIKEHPTEVGKYLTPHPYMKYVDPNYAKAEFHDEKYKDEYDKKYEGVFTDYHVTWRPGLYKLWMNIEGGAVCGGISKIGSNIRGVNGIPSSVISQPGHAALIYYSQDENGNGYWNIDNDVSGWAQSGKTERLSLRSPLGWGDDDYAEGWLASYVPLAQDAINNFDDYTESMRYVYLANSYSQNPDKQMELYREALKVMPINIDAWYEIIKLYESDSTKTNKQYLDLAEEIGEALKLYPLPMYNLTNRIKNDFDKTNQDEYTRYMFRFTLFQTDILTTASTWENSKDRPEKGTSEADITNYYTNWTYQPSVTKAVSKFLLGQTDTELAKFSFDTVETVVKAEKEGEEDKVVVTAEAGVLRLSDRFNESKVRWDYTLGGKSYNEKDYKEVIDTNKIKLSDEELAKLSADNDIYVHIVGTEYSDDTLYKIDILPQEVSSEIYANDLENRILGVDNKLTEWRYVENSEIALASELSEASENESWVSFEKESPELKGDVTVEIRQRANGTKLASNSVQYKFTSEGENNLTRRYVPVSHLSIHKVSTEATAQGRYAKNAIDGNYNTNFHSAWNGTDTERYMIIKIDRPIYVSGIEYVPGGGGNGRLLDVTISVSPTAEDGSWKEIYSAKDLQYVDTNNANAPDFGLKNIKKFDTTKTEDELKEIGKVQYIKIKADRATNGNWFTARMFNIFENVRLNPQPTASVEFTTTDPTNENVVAKITNFSADTIEMIIDNEEIEQASSFATISEDGKTATFTKNGSYTFKFKNTETEHEGIATANVTWIDKEAPTATIEYSTETVTNGEVVAKLVPSEPVIVTSNSHTEYNSQGKEYTFTTNGEFKFEYKDLAGNEGTPVVATVNWINSSSGDMIADGPELDENQQGGTTPEETPPSSEEQKPGETIPETKPEEQTPGSGEENTPGTTTPGTEESKDSTTPGGEEQKPGDSEQEETPGTKPETKPEEQTPGSGEENTPGTTTPGTEESKDPTTPGGEEQKPGDSEQEQKPGETTPETKPEEQKPGTSEDNKKPSDGNTTNTPENKPNSGNTTNTTDKDKKPSSGNTTTKPNNNNNNQKPGSGSSKSDDTKSKENLPNTGKKAILITGISLATAWSLISYIRYVNLGKKKYRR